MDLDFFPDEITAAFKACDLSDIYEIRLRAGFPILMKGTSKTYYLGKLGKTVYLSEGYVCTKKLIEETLGTVTERSLYAFNDQIKRGFITARGGIRIGIAGECVTEGEKVITIKNITSLNIRIPHEIEGCSKGIYDTILKDRLFNTLIIAPPSMGKTTLLKDLARRIDKSARASVLIIDEREEFLPVAGMNTDIIRKSDKLYAFEYGIRSMAPGVIITDELCGEKDWQCAKAASDSGVKIIASIHGAGISDVSGKKFFIPGVFERYVLLKTTGLPGITDKIYNEELAQI